MAVDRNAVAVVVEGDQVAVYARAGMQAEFAAAAAAATQAGRVRTTTVGPGVGLLMDIGVAREAGLVAKPRGRKPKNTSSEEKA